MFKKAFTLAEVLITLMIIGIVAALTIPSVISNYQQQEYKTGLKKAVSVLNEAIQTNIAQEGDTPYETMDILGYLTRHMSLTNNGGHYETDSATNEYWSNNRYVYTVDGMRFESPSFDGTVSKHLRLHESDVTLVPRKDPNNPSVISSTTLSMHCGSYGLANNPNNTVTPPCAVLVDVNGDKKPNPSVMIDVLYANGEVQKTTRGKYLYPSPNDKKLTDVFNILITEDRAIPFGVVAQRAMYSK